jgi:guanylate kinase
MKKPAQQNNHGTLYIIAAASGTGKTSLTKALVETINDLKISISHTTRSIRPDEKNNESYFFIDETAFKKMIAADAFLEHAQVFGHYYGTSSAFVMQNLHNGTDVILNIDWQGAQQIREKMHILGEQCVSIFLLPPSKEVLRHRLESRKSDKAEVIAHRLEQAEHEMKHCKEFDYLVINDDFSSALNDLQAIILAQRLQQSRQAIKYSKLLQELID